MKPVKVSVGGLICATLMLGVCLVCGCNRKPAISQHPDEIDSVDNALMFNGLFNVAVSQNRTQGVMTLSGVVVSPDQKAQAAVIASTNASDYTIANDVTVTPPAAQAKPAPDSQIKAKYHAHASGTPGS
jgi:hypothetical protein